MFSENRSPFGAELDATYGSEVHRYANLRISVETMTRKGTRLCVPVFSRSPTTTNQNYITRAQRHDIQRWFKATNEMQTRW